MIRRTGRLWAPLAGALLLSLVLLAGGCDSGPSGPGDLNGSLQAPSGVLGGAVLEVTGKGITSFGGAGSTRVYWAATSVPDTYRVVLVNQSPGSLQFKVAMEDKGGKKPTAAVVTLVGGDNLPINITDAHRVTFTRG